MNFKSDVKTDLKVRYGSETTVLLPVLSAVIEGGPVPPPPVSDADLDRVADLTRLGRFQHKIAEELDWEPSRVKRALKTLRIRVAVRSGEIWLDTREKSPVEVALEWLRLRAS